MFQTRARRHATNIRPQPSRGSQLNAAPPKGVERAVPCPRARHHRRAIQHRGYSAQPRVSARMWTQAKRARSLVTASQSDRAGILPARARRCTMPKSRHPVHAAPNPSAGRRCISLGCVWFAFRCVLIVCCCVLVVYCCVLVVYRCVFVAFRVCEAGRSRNLCLDTQLCFCVWA